MSGAMGHNIYHTTVKLRISFMLYQIQTTSNDTETIDHLINTGFSKFPDFHKIFKFLDFSLQGFFFIISRFPESVTTLI